MNFESSNLKCFIIHLKRAKARKVFVDNIIKNISLKTEIIEAVDGNLLTNIEVNNILNENKAFRPKYPFKINSGEIGCFLSHRKAWRQIVDQNLDAGLILEDDIRIDHFTFDKSLKFAIQNIKSCKYVQFQVREIKKKYKILKSQNELELLHPTPTLLRTSAQLVSYDAAIELLEITSKIDRPIDTMLQMFWKTNIKCFCINKSGITDHTFEAGGSTLSKKSSTKFETQFKIRRNIKRLIYRTKIHCFSKYKIFKETL